jgi:hypothetical protein
MPSFKAELDTETKLYTALGFGEKRSTEPFLDSARAGAYTHGKDSISLNENGQAVVKSVIDGKAELPTFIDFSKAELSLPKKMEYDVNLNAGASSGDASKSDAGHLALSAEIFGSGVTFNVQNDGKNINGSCTTRKGITYCDETVKDGAGHTLLKGHTIANMYQNPTDFQRTTTYADANDHLLGEVSQHVKFNKADKTIEAETWVKQQ